MANQKQTEPDPDYPTVVPLGVRIKYIVSETWKFFFTIFVPILLLPLLAWKPEGFEKVSSAVYLAILMAAFWISECLPLAITSLIPIVLVPLFGITGSEEICGVYFNHVILFLFGGCVVALSFEYSDLHSRISFFVMKSMGSKATVLLFGMMMTCMMLSCWMNNTSTTAMMVPVIISIMAQYKECMIPKETAVELADKYGNSNPDHAAAESQSNNEAALDNQTVPSRSSTVAPGEVTAENDTFAKEQDNVGGDTQEDPSMVEILQPKNQVMDESTVSKWSNKDENIKYWQDFIDSKKMYVRNLEVMFLFGVAVASNIGGTGVITGTGTNLIAVSQLRTYRQKTMEMHPSNIANPVDCFSAKPEHAYWEVDFLRWIILNFFGMFINVIASWMFLSIYFQGVPSGIKNFWRTTVLRKKPDVLTVKKAAELKQVSGRIRSAIKTKYEELGQTSFHQWMVLGVFTLLVFLWIFRNPMFGRGKAKTFDRWDKLSNDTIKLTNPKCWSGGRAKAMSKLRSTWGWSRFFGDDCDENFLHDYVSTMFGCLLLFVLPKEWKYYKTVLQGGLMDGVEDPLLPMKFVVDNMPWGPIFMLGGGFGISKAISEAMLDKFLSEQLNKWSLLKELSTDALLGATFAFVAVLTSIASNTATAVIISPILIELARVKGVPPLLLVVPPVVGASYAFCFPISTPPNAIVYYKGNMKQKDMFVPGLYLTVLCNALLFLTTKSWTSYVLDVANYKGPCNISTVVENSSAVDRQRSLIFDELFAMHV